MFHKRSVVLCKKQPISLFDFYMSWSDSLFSTAGDPLLILTSMTTSHDQRNAADATLLTHPDRAYSEPKVTRGMKEP